MKTMKTNKHCLWTVFAIVCMLAVILCGMSISVSAAYTAGDIPNTSGCGQTKDDPVVCDRFEELKAALEHKEVTYVKLKNLKWMSGEAHGQQVLPDAEGYNPAIEVKGTKYLNVDGDVTFITSGAKYSSLIYVYSSTLNISGKGSLTYKHDANTSVIHLGFDGTVNVSGQVTIMGEAAASKFNIKVSAIFASGGNETCTLNVTGGTLKGSIYEGDTEELYDDKVNGTNTHNYHGAVILRENAHANITGGEFTAGSLKKRADGTIYFQSLSYPVGLRVENDCTATITGGTFKNNQASDDAGVLYITGIYSNKVETVMLTMQNATFLSNSAADCGGVVNVLKNRIITATITGCTFESCTAATGGAIDYRSGWNTSSLDISDNSFKNNTSSALGGAIILVNTVYSVGLKDNVFEGNASPGGKDLSVYTKNSDVTLSGSNSLDVYFTEFSTLKLAEDFDTSSKITVAYKTAPAKGTAIVKCSNASLATNALGSFTLQGDNLSGFDLATNGSNLVLSEKSILRLLLSFID